MEDDCTLAECPPGPFLFNGSLGFKTEYCAVLPKDVGGGKVEFNMSNWPEAYCMDSGEFFWGGAKTHAERAGLIVQPVDVSALSPTDTKEG